VDAAASRSARDITPLSYKARPRAIYLLAFPAFLTSNNIRTLIGQLSF
jgi:hypothetical protein